MITSNGYTLDASARRLGALTPVPDAVRGDRDAMWTRLRADGHLFLTHHLDPQLVLEFREYYFTTLLPTGLVDHSAAPRSGISGAGQVDLALTRQLLFDQIVPGDEYRALASHPQIRDWFSWFIDGDVHLHRRKIIRHTRPGESGIGTATQAHYDLVYIREGSENVLTMWIPLGDCSVTMGGLAYLEGSHHWAMADEQERGLHRPAASMTADLPRLANEHDSRWLVADYRAGDVVVHSSYMVHAGTDNLDTERRLRLSTDIRYQAASEPLDWRWQKDWSNDDGL